MTTNAQDAINTTILALNRYVSAIHEYNTIVQQNITEWAEQRNVYEAWLSANNWYMQYLAGVSSLTQSLTSETRIPVPALSVVGIGILGLGVIYIESDSGIMVGNPSHPFYETVEPEYNETGYVMHVGGLPEGTIIYTTLGTYSIQQGQAINLMVG